MMSDFAAWLREWEESGNVKRLSYTEDLANLCAQLWVVVAEAQDAEGQMAAMRAAEEFREKYG